MTNRIDRRVVACQSYLLCTTDPLTPKALPLKIRHSNIKHQSRFPPLTFVLHPKEVIWAECNADVVIRVSRIYTFKSQLRPSNIPRQPVVPRLKICEASTIFTEIILLRHIRVIQRQIPRRRITSSNMPVRLSSTSTITHSNVLQEDNEGFT